jgi:phenylpropionate dioxygenase-like ring-hydroxylating dioxygenase large terminal subunit
MTTCTDTLAATKTNSPFPLDRWYLAALSKELTDKPIARTLLNHPIVLYRTLDGQVNALQDRCCHRQLPLSMGTIEEGGLRCGYHGLLFDGQGKCLEVPGQQKVPRKAKVEPYLVIEQDDLVWMWFGSEQGSTPDKAPPSYAYHAHPDYVYDGGMFHYEAPYQLIHDNLLDLSHLGYVHLKTIGGDAKTHMNAEMLVETEGETVTVKRYMPNSTPPPTYIAAYPFKGKIDRWQEIEFCPSHLRIWTGGIDANSEQVTDPNRGGFHMRGLHCITPETDETSLYFWTIATNPKTDIENIKQKVVEQTRFTFNEDKVVIEAQHKSMQHFKGQPMIDIHVDTGANHARKIIKSLCETSS